MTIMVTNELLDFISAQRDAGVSIEEIERMLITDGGWDKEDVAEALRVLGMNRAVVSPPPEPATYSSFSAPLSPRSDADTLSAPIASEIGPAFSPDISVDEETFTPDAALGAFVQTTALPMENRGGVVTPSTADSGSLIQPDTRSFVSNMPSVSPGAEHVSVAPPAPQSDEWNLVLNGTEPPTPPSASVAPVSPLAMSSVSPREPSAVFSSVEASGSALENRIQTVEHDDFLGLFGAPTSPESVTAPSAYIPNAPAPLSEAEKHQSASEWSLQYALAHAGNAASSAAVVEEEKSPIAAELPPSQGPVPGVPPSAFRAAPADVPLSRVTEGESSSPAVPEDSPQRVFTHDSAGASVEPFSRRMERAMLAEELRNPLPPPQSQGDYSPEERLFVKGTAAHADPSEWKDKSVTSASVAELWLARGGKPAPTSAAPVKPSISDAPDLAEKKSTPPHQEEHRAKGSLRWVFVAVVLFLVLGLLVGGLYWFTRGGANLAGSFNDAVTKLFVVETLGYSVEARADLELTAQDLNGGAGSFRFALDAEGAVAQGARGYGDGAHRFHLVGGLRSGTLIWQTDIDADVRIIGRSLYFHARDVPPGDTLDPDLLRTYWVKVDLAEISRELDLASAGGASYGSFGASDPESAFGTVFQRHMPLRVIKLVGKEMVNGVETYRYELMVDPTLGIEFLRTIAVAMLGRELTMTEDERVRMIAALEKLHGDAWVGAEDGMLKKFTLGGELDDELLLLRVKGPIGITILPTTVANPPSVETPTPVLSLEEFRVRMDEYRKTQALRAEDTTRIAGMAEVRTALGAYKAEFARYPDTLNQLVQNGILASTTQITADEIADYTYYGYKSDGSFDRKNRCDPKAKICPAYHLGVNLHDITNPELAKDADKKGDISGDDALGCGKEKDLACFDVVEFSAAAAPPK